MPAETQPLLLIVSGEPGSGKTRLSQALAEATGLLRVSKTDLARAMAATRPDDEDNHDRAWRTYWDVLEVVLSRRAGVIADQTTWRGQCEGPISSRLAPLASVANVHCRAAAAPARWRAALREVHRLDDDGVSAAVARMAGRRDRVAEPLDLACPRLEVDTTDGYRPGLPAVLRFVAEVPRDRPPPQGA